MSTEHLEILVEEYSAEVLLEILLPKIVGEVSFKIRTFEGKMGLLRKLPERLNAYSRWVPGSNTRIAILIDEDRQDCSQLKAKLENLAAMAGLRSKTVAGGTGEFSILNRIAIEELEAWYFGDCDALRAAFPRVPASLEARSSYRDPDAVPGGTWQRLEKVLQGAGYFPSGMPKVEIARVIGPNMLVEENRSNSFIVFRDGLRELVGH